MVIPERYKINNRKITYECGLNWSRVAGESLGKSPLADYALRNQYCMPNNAYIWYSG